MTVINKFAIIIIRLTFEVLKVKPDFDIYKETSLRIKGSTGIRIDFHVMPEELPSYSPHWHDSMEILYIANGSLINYFDKIKQTAFSGEAVIIPPKQMHAGKPCPDGAELYAIHIDIAELSNKTIASRNFLQPLVDQKIDICKITDNKAVTDAAKDLIVSYNSRHPLNTIGNVYQLLGTLYESLYTSQKANSEIKMAEVFKYISLHFNELLTTDSLARLFNYNESYFCRQFKKTTGFTVLNYIKYLRIEKSCHLLKETDMGIMDIANYCGFNDFSYFCCCFRKIIGTTPTMYRKEIKSLNNS